MSDSSKLIKTDQEDENGNTQHDIVRRTLRVPTISKEKRGRLEALNQIRRQRAGLSSEQDNKVNEAEEDIYDLVDEEEYNEITKKRRRQFVVDDDEGLYADDGEDRWDSNFYNDSSLLPKKGRKRNSTKKTEQKKEAAEGDDEEKPKPRLLEKLFNKSFKPVQQQQQQQQNANFVKSLNSAGNEAFKDLLLNPLDDDDEQDFFVSTVKSEPVDEEEMLVREPPNIPTKKVVAPKPQPILAREEKSPIPTSTLTLVHKKVDESIKEEKVETVETPKELPTSFPETMDTEDDKPKAFTNEFKLTPFNTESEWNFATPSQAPIGKKVYPPLDLKNGKLLFYWLDAAGNVAASCPGTVFLFGKVVTASGMYGCTCRVSGLTRRLYFIPKEKDDAGNPISIKDVYREAKEVLKDSTITGRQVTRKYVFGDPNVPYGESTVFKVKTSFARQLPVLPKSGKTYSAVLGVTTTPLETLIVRRKLKGPQWLEIEQCTVVEPSKAVTISPYEIEVKVPHNIHVLGEDEGHLSTGKPESADENASQGNPSHDEKTETAKKLAGLTTPVISGVVLNITTVFNPFQKQSEIAVLTCISHRAFSIENASMDGPGCTTSWVRPCQAQMEGKGAAKSIFPIGTAEFFKNNRIVTLCNSEKEIVEKFIKYLEQENPDVLIGHNLYEYQFPVLIRALKEHHIANWSFLGRFRRSGPIVKQSANFIISGRMAIDTFSISKELLKKQKNYHLKELAKTQLSLDIEEVPEENVPLYFTTKEKIREIISHNINECNMCIRLVMKLAVIPLYKQITNQSGMVWGRVFMGLRAERVEYLLLHNFVENKYIVPEHNMTKYEPSKHKGYLGGMVLDPVPGLYGKWILLLDFKSLYPSIIQEYNICFTTVDFAKTPDELPTETTPGILPRVVKALVAKRQEVKTQIRIANSKARELKDKGADSTALLTQVKQLDIRQSALKILANSLYGCLGYTRSRFYAKPLAAMITKMGRETLLNSKNIVTEELGMQVIYGDTDSLMIHTGPGLTEEQARSKAKEIQDRINRESKNKALEIELDGLYAAILLLKKKKYAALECTPKGDFVKVVKGLDIVRRDWADVARTAGSKVVDFILSVKDENSSPAEDICKYLNELGTNIRTGKIPLESFVISKGLSMELAQYPDAESLPHVQVALRQQRNNKRVQVGDHIPFIICKSGTGDISPGEKSIAKLARHQNEVIASQNTANPFRIDTDFYLEQQVFAVVSRLCSPIDLQAVDVAIALGIDPQRVHVAPVYAQQMVITPIDETDEESFSGTTPFIACPCNAQNPFSIDQIGKACTCERHTFFSEAFVQNALEAHLNKLKERYMMRELICTDCKQKTRQLFFKRGFFASPHCINSDCKGTMISNQPDFFREYLYLNHIFKTNNELKKQLKAFIDSCKLCTINFHELTDCWAKKK